MRAVSDCASVQKGLNTPEPPPPSRFTVACPDGAGNSEMLAIKKFENQRSNHYLPLINMALIKQLRGRDIFEHPQLPQRTCQRNIFKDLSEISEEEIPLESSTTIDPSPSLSQDSEPPVILYIYP